MSEPARSAAEPRRLAPRQALRDRVAAGIVAAAAEVFAAEGPAPSMNDVAAAAGVARATLYRYFPTRQALLARLAEVGVDNAGTRLAQAQLDRVGVDEGVVRAVRALLEVGDYFAVLAREHGQPRPKQYEEAVAHPVRGLIERGQANGALRTDIPRDWLANALVDLVVSVIRANPALGRDDTVAAISGLFLDGARKQPLPVHDDEPRSA